MSSQQLLATDDLGNHFYGDFNMKYGIQFNDYSKKYRVMQKQCGDRAKWMLAHLGYELNDKAVKNEFDTKEAAIAAITAKVNEDAERNRVYDAWEAAATEEVNL